MSTPREMPDSEPSTPASLAASAASIGAAIGRYRWVICALLFGATTINYVDRQVIGILKNELQRSIGWNEQAYGNIVAAFQAAYAIGLLLAGGLMDRIGTRRGFAGAVSFWSLAGVGHALALGLHPHRRVRVRLASLLAGALPPARGAPGLIEGGARAHPERPAGGGRPDPVGPAAAAPSDLGVRPRQAPHRSDLVVLPLLDTGLPAEALWARPQEHRPAAGCHLSGGGCRQHRGRLALLGVDRARLERECRTKSPAPLT